MPAEERNIPATLTEKQANALALLRNLDLEDLAILKGVLHQGEPKVIGPHTIDALVLKCDDLKMPLTNKGVVALKDKYKLQKTGDPKTEIGPTTAETLYQAILSLAGKSPFCFPFSKMPSADWTSGWRKFAANRGPRAHAGCDLYFPAGTPIHAVGDGTVIQSAYYFYNGTYALEVDHGDFIVRYGEIQANPPVKGGAKVKRGQVIAKVGHLTGITVPSDMLHMEMYDGSLSGPLTVGAALSKRRASDNKPFMRRKDLIDPTDYLNDWRDDLP